jgi:ArsR family transcriptional regulator, lead/cadmium/zinc/bismuth-responsive transcriptional repressor
VKLIPLAGDEVKTLKELNMCEVTCVDDDKVKRVQNQFDVNCIAAVAKLFKALSDETRMKIAYALSLEEELCVCDVANIVGASTATTSHHLRHLHNQGLAKYRKEGKLVYYSLDDDHVRNLINIAFTHHQHTHDT